MHKSPPSPRVGAVVTSRQVNAKTELALRYNDISPLENHHAAVAFEILSCDTSNVIKHLTPENHKRFRSGMIKLVWIFELTC